VEDIVERLRDGQFCGQWECHYCDVMRRAADEIERLRAALRAIAGCQSDAHGDIMYLARLALADSK